MNAIFDRLSQGKQVSLARFNDGEVGAMFRVLKSTSRGEQRVTNQLVEQLSDALNYRGENYFIGFPCPLCYPEYYQFIMQEIQHHKYKILSTFSTNHNYNLFFNELFRILRKGKRDWCYVSDKLVGGPDVTGKWYPCPSVNASEKADEILLSLGDHEVYILTCGAVSRYLAMELHKQGKSALDLGSIFDPLKGKVRRNGKPINAHVWETPYRNKTEYCSICNYAGTL